MIYNRNGEGYADPTAGEAIANIRRQERKEKRKAHIKQQKKTSREEHAIKETENGRI